MMACVDLYATGQNSITLKSKDLATRGFQKFQAHPPKPTETKPSFGKVSVPPAKLCMLFPG